MVSKAKCLSLLPPFQGMVSVITWHQSTKRLIKEIVKAHQDEESDYDKIGYLFDTGNIYSTCNGLWDFCKYNMQYGAEGEDEQTVRTPTAILQDGLKVDCKHYSLFIGGVIDAISAANNLNTDWCYRFASYEPDKVIGHVFVVVKDGVNEIWVDPVLGEFNRKKQPTYFIDKKPDVMPISKISGVGDANSTISVYTENVEPNFLVMVNKNFLGLKDLLNSNVDITNGSFKDWYKAQGYDFNQLQLILRA